LNTELAHRDRATLQSISATVVVNLPSSVVIGFGSFSLTTFVCHPEPASGDRMTMGYARGELDLESADTGVGRFVGDPEGQDGIPGPLWQRGRADRDVGRRHSRPSEGRRDQAAQDDQSQNVDGTSVITNRAGHFRYRVEASTCAVGSSIIEIDQTAASYSTFLVTLTIQ